MSQALHHLKVKRQEAFAVFLRERLINEMATIVADGWPAFMKVASYLYDPEQLASQEKQDDYVLSVLVRTMSEEAVKPGVFSPLEDPSGRNNLHLLKDLERGLNQENPDLRKRFTRLKDHLADLSKMIRTAYEESDDPAHQRKLIMLSKQRENIFESAMERAVSMKKRRDASFTPRALVLQGGGAKGMAYSGVIDTLESNGSLANIKHVAGTSAGALMGLPVAMGYTAAEVKDIVQNGRFAQFFAESTVPVSFLAKYKDRIKDSVKVGWGRMFGKTHLTAVDTHASPHTEGFMLKDFSREYLIPLLIEHTDLKYQHLMNASEEVVQQELSDLDNFPRKDRPSLAQIYGMAKQQFERDMAWRGMEEEAKTLRFPTLFGRSEQLQCAIQCIRFAKSKVHPEVETIEEFIGDIIQHRLDKMPPHKLLEISPPIKTREDKRNISFTQLRQLSQQFPEEGFKEFGVAITDHYLPLTPSGVLRMCARAVQKVNDAWHKKTPVDDGLGVLDNRFFFKPLLARAASADGRFGEFQDMPIKKAVRASMNLPGLFNTIKYNNAHMVDGGINNNLPQRLFSDRFSSPQEADEQTIGFILSPLESDLEFQGVDDLIKNKDGKLRIILDEEIRDQMRAFEINHHNSVDETALGALDRLWDKAKITMMRAISVSIRNVMAHHNSTPITEDALNNIGVINTGEIDTADFHISIEEKQALHSAGEIAALNLMDVHEDRHYRYAICRLRSLTLQERLLSEKLGMMPSSPQPIDTYSDSEMLRQALADSRLDSWSLGEVLQGRV